MTPSTPDREGTGMSSSERSDSNVGPVTIRGLVVRPDDSLERRIEKLEGALTGLVLELVENGALPPEAPDVATR